jgi:hypothetical protein
MTVLLLQMLHYLNSSQTEDASGFQTAQKTIFPF